MIFPFFSPKLKINNYGIRPTESTKFLGVLLGENLTWKPHIKYAKKKKNYEKYWIII